MPSVSTQIFYLFFLGPALFMLYTRFMATTMQSVAPDFSATDNHSRVVIIGSGLAGLSAASELVSRSVAVHVLERAQKPGGNSYKASSGINGAPTQYQSIKDESFYDDTLRSAGTAIAQKTQQRERLMKTLTDQSADAISWLATHQNIDLSAVAQLGGHSVPRTHRPGPSVKKPVGMAIVDGLLEHLRSSPLFKLEVSCQVLKLLRGGNVITGVEYRCNDEATTQTLYGPVIVAAGGFAGDAAGLLARHRPDLAGYPTTNEARPGGVSLLSEAGAALLDMEEVQIHPTGFVDPSSPSSPSKFLAAEVLRGEGGVLLNNHGQRFVDEMQNRKVVTAAILESCERQSQESPQQWDVKLVLDEGAYEATRNHMGFYLFKNLMRKTTLRELGPNALQTLQAYSSAAAGKTADPLKRSSFGHWSLQDPSEDSVIYVGHVTPVVHFTMGGAAINEFAQILDEHDRPMEGVWAAGEVTGGVHGENRLGGSSLLECVVFGRIAGGKIAKSLGV